MRLLFYILPLLLGWSGGFHELTVRQESDGAVAAIFSDSTGRNVLLSFNGAATDTMLVRMEVREETLDRFGGRVHVRSEKKGYWEEFYGWADKGQCYTTLNLSGDNSLLLRVRPDKDSPGRKVQPGIDIEANVKRIHGDWLEVGFAIGTQFNGWICPDEPTSVIVPSIFNGLDCRPLESYQVLSPESETLIDKIGVPIDSLICEIGEPDSCGFVMLDYMSCGNNVLWSLTRNYSRYQLGLKLYRWNGTGARPQFNVLCLQDDELFDVGYPDIVGSSPDGYAKWISSDSGDAGWRVAFWDYGDMDWYKGLYCGGHGTMMMSPYRKGQADYKALLSLYFGNAEIDNKNVKSGKQSSRIPVKDIMGLSPSEVYEHIGTPVSKFSMDRNLYGSIGLSVLSSNKIFDRPYYMSEWPWGKAIDLFAADAEEVMVEIYNESSEINGEDYLEYVLYAESDGEWKSIFAGDLAWFKQVHVEY